VRDFVKKKIDIDAHLTERLLQVENPTRFVNNLITQFFEMKLVVLSDETLENLKKIENIPEELKDMSALVNHFLNEFEIEFEAPVKKRTKVMMGNKSNPKIVSKGRNYVKEF
jgi:division protein CdvB (Snf7/Vps24/ESCRT-III family)